MPASLAAAGSHIGLGKSVSGVTFSMIAASIEVEAELVRLQGILRERLSETLARKVVELVIAEMMSSYRSQVQPPSRAVQ